MFLLDWYRQWVDIRYEMRNRNVEVKQVETVCASCETLRQQLEISNYEKQKLLDRLLEKPEAPKETTAPLISVPRTVPWRVRQQMLEREDRVKAQKLRDAPKSDSEIEQEKAENAAFDKELEDATKAREAEGTISRGA